jgi:hypothetical protein
MSPGMCATFIIYYIHGPAILSGPLTVFKLWILFVLQTRRSLIKWCEV